MKFWAKSKNLDEPGIDVFNHALNVSSVAEALYCAARLPPCISKNIPSNFVYFLAASHDCGKISYDFQTKLKKWAESNNIPLKDVKRKPHGRYTYETLVRYFKHRFQVEGIEKIVWAMVSGCHHGELFECYSPDVVPKRESNSTRSRNEPDWEMHRRDLLNKLADTYGVTSLPSADQATPALWYISGLISLADWLGSDETNFPADRELSESERRERARKVLAELRLMPLNVKKGLTFEQVFGFLPNSLQSAAEGFVTEPGTYILEAPMGMGKTEAALWCSYKLIEQGKAGGIYFALPTQLSSNRIWIRTQEFIDRICPDHQRTQLIHGNSWLVREDGDLRNPTDDSYAERWFASSKRALFAPCGVGTIDQSLMAVLPIKHFFMRRYALAGKVVILDEVHSYDVYTSSLIQNFCRTVTELGATVIILSATLTNKARNSLIGGALSDSDQISIPTVCLTGKKTEGECVVQTEATPPSPKTVFLGNASEHELFLKAMECCEQGGCVLWICDTVSSAQRVYGLLKTGTGLSGDRLGLLHSRFIYGDREKKEAYWIGKFGKNAANREGCILVSTQIVEQSLDIDADLLITELAPTDMLLQRIGRLHRHHRAGRRFRAECWMLRECIDNAASFEELKRLLGNKAYVYFPDILARTWNVWKELPKITLPGDIRRLLEDTYSEEIPDITKAIEEARMDREGREIAERQLAEFATNVWSMTLDDDENIKTDFSTRLSSNETENVLICSDFDEEHVTLFDGSVIHFNKQCGFNKTTARVLNKNTVKLRKGKVKSCPEEFFQSFLKTYRIKNMIRAVDSDGVSESVHYDSEIGFR